MPQVGKYTKWRMTGVPLSPALMLVLKTILRWCQWRLEEVANFSPAGGDAYAYHWLRAVFAIVHLSWIITWLWTSSVRPLFPLIARFLILLPAVSPKSDSPRRSAHHPWSSKAAKPPLRRRVVQSWMFCRRPYS